MRSFSFILALGLMLTSPSMAGPAEGTLPGVGTFAYNGTTTAAAAPLLMADVH